MEALPYLTTAKVDWQRLWDINGVKNSFIRANNGASKFKILGDAFLNGADNKA